MSKRYSKASATCALRHAAHLVRFGSCRQAPSAGRAHTRRGQWPASTGLGRTKTSQPCNLRFSAWRSPSVTDGYKREFYGGVAMDCCRQYQYITFLRQEECAALEDMGDGVAREPCSSLADDLVQHRAGKPGAFSKRALHAGAGNSHSGGGISKSGAASSSLGTGGPCAYTNCTNS